jgi:hypothetical protein
MDGPDLTALFEVVPLNVPEMAIATMEPVSASLDSLEFTAHCPHAHHHAQEMANAFLLDHK